MTSPELPVMRIISSWKLKRREQIVARFQQADAPDLFPSTAERGHTSQSERLRKKRRTFM
jgi:hypothetical protein